MIKLKPLRPPTQEPVSAGSKERFIVDCGRVSEIGPEAVRPLITALDERHGFQTDVGHLTVFGRCRDCRTETP